MMTDLSIDIETMALAPNALLVQIGAVRFNLESGQIDTPLLLDVDSADAHRLGGITSPATVGWWNQQGGFKHVGLPLPVAACLDIVRQYGHGVERVWCKGPAFDVPILDFYSASTGVYLPWKFWQVRDVRTLVDIAERRTGHRFASKATHRADEDATVQTRDILSAWLVLSRA